jgi:hypothetical protein
VNNTCSFGKGVKGGLVAGDSITQLVICERTRLHFGLDMVTVGGLQTHLMDMSAAGTVSLLKEAWERCQRQALDAQALSASSCSVSSHPRCYTRRALSWKGTG